MLVEIDFTASLERVECEGCDEEVERGKYDRFENNAPSYL
jgi:hypothetical protein